MPDADPSPLPAANPADVVLEGPWRAAVADEDLRRRYPAADFDDTTWDDIVVQGARVLRELSAVLAARRS